LEERFKELGFTNITFTGLRKDALNMKINEVKPSLLLIGSGFYQAGTPYMTGELHKTFPRLNIAAISLLDYPLRLAPWFIWYGAKSYLDLWDKGYKEFHRGLRIIRDGGQYISPRTEKIIEDQEEWPDTKSNVTKRMQECLIMLCCGFEPEEIGEELHVTKKTVYNHLGFLYSMFHVENREEMVAVAWELELVTKEDIRFYRHGRKEVTLPEWAAISKRAMRNEQ
jgi:DNA-binding NarL/FixJ family response regulator